MGLISYLTTIRFDDGAIAGIGSDLSELGITRPLIIADKGVVAAGLVARLVAAVPALHDAPVFDEVPSNPTESAARRCLTMIRDTKADGLVAIGGGSPIDLAKVAALLATHPGPLADHAAIHGGIARIGPVLPLIAIPTTAGTGSEVGRAALLTLDDGRKLGFISPHLIPKRAICDPGLTHGLPPRLTAATGMDALTHCIETFLSPRDNPPAEAIALDGLARGATALPAAVRDGANGGARREMMMAALMGGLTFQKGLGAVHSLSHALGGLDGTLHHGMLNAILLPAVLGFNAGVIPHKIERLRRALDLSPGVALDTWARDTTTALGLPTTLSALGASRDIFARAATIALADHSTPTNPAPLTESDLLRLLDESW